jgi:tetratricopeptide (TPR) repeat protein
VNPLYADGILYALQPPTAPAPTPDFEPGNPPSDFKSRQILINLELTRGEDLLSRTPPDSSGAWGCFQRALDLLEGEPRGTLHNQLGISFRHLGIEDFALICYERALHAPRLSRSDRKEVIFNTSNIYKDRGNRLIKADNLSGAVEAFIKALEYDPENAKLMYNIGLIYVQYLKRKDLGLPFLESYLKLNPTDENAEKLIRQLRGQ